MIQHKVVLSVAVLLWAARYKHVVVPKEVLQADNLEEDKIRRNEKDDDIQKGIRQINLF